MENISVLHLAARIDRDENGNPKRNAETKKIMRKDMHPNLKPFIL